MASSSKPTPHPEILPDTTSDIEMDDASYARLIEHSPMPIAVHAGGILLFANQATARLMHVDSPKKLIGRNVMEFVHPDSQELVKRRMADIYKRGKDATNIIEEKFICDDGSIIQVEIASLLFYYQGEPAVQLVLRDVTAQAKARMEIEHSNALLSTITNNASLGLLMMDDRQYCTFMNPAAKAITGFTLHELQGAPLHNFLHNKKSDGSSYPVKECPINHALMSNKRKSGEELFVHKNGSLYPIHFTVSPIKESGEPVGTVIEIQDLSEEKKAQESLIRSEENFRQLADSMPQIVWSALPDGTIDYRNRKWFDYTGFSDQSHSTAWDNNLHPDDKELINQAWGTSLEKGVPYQVEFRMRDKHRPGRYRWFLARAVPVKNSAGVITRWFGTSTDIDDTKRTAKRTKELERIAAALTEQRAQLVELNRAKDEFISLASHQLRTPATGVKQYIGMALEGYAGDLSPELRAFLQRAYDSNERQIAIVNDLLKVAQVDAGKVVLDASKINVVDLVQQAIQEHASHFKERSQTVLFKPRQKSINIIADAARLRMVLDNIIDNASKYTWPGKSIHIDVATARNMARISVSDEGVGISPDDIDKIFRKFSRLDNPLSAHVGGSGLGLYWARKIIDLHNGSISVASEVDKGTTFTICLPR